MKSSFLEELGKFISDNHLFRGSYDRIFISNSFLPQSFRKEIYNIALRYSNSMDLDDSFILMFDKDKKHLCMLFTFFNGKTTILVKDTDDHVQMDGKYTPCMLDDVILDASKTISRRELLDIE